MNKLQILHENQERAFQACSTNHTDGYKEINDNIHQVIDFVFTPLLDHPRFHVMRLPCDSVNETLIIANSKKLKSNGCVDVRSLAEALTLHIWEELSINSIYAQYIPLLVSPLPESFHIKANTFGLMTRYGKIYNA